MERLFVYGTLRYAQYQRECWGRSFSGIRASLHAYARDRILINERKYYVLYPQRDSVVRGLILLVTKTDLEVSDVYEEKYDRRRVQLADGTEAWTYITQPHYLRNAKRTP